MSQRIKMLLLMILTYLLGCVLHKCMHTLTRVKWEKEREISIASVVTIPHPFRGIRNGSESFVYSQSRANYSCTSRRSLHTCELTIRVFAAPTVFITLWLSQLRVRSVALLLFKVVSKRTQIVFVQEIESTSYYYLRYSTSCEFGWSLMYIFARIALREESHVIILLF